MTWNLSAFADEADIQVDGQIKALQRADMKFVDLRNVEGVNISELPLDHAANAKAKFDAAGITVAMFGSPVGKIDIADDFQVDLKKLDHMGKLADVLGCRSIRIFSYYNKGNQPLDQWQKVSLDRLGQLRSRASQLGLKLYHENERHIFGDRLPQVKVLLQTLRDGKSFFGIFDFDNYNQSGDDVWQNWLELRDMTDAIHLKDSDKNSEIVPVGEGNGQVKRIMSDTLTRSWNGPLSLEPHLYNSSTIVASGFIDKEHVTYQEIPKTECFHIAVMIAKSLLKEVRALVV